MGRLLSFQQACEWRLRGAVSAPAAAVSEQYDRTSCLRDTLYAEYTTLR